jgi:hypothetical protein
MVKPGYVWTGLRGCGEAGIAGMPRSAGWFAGAPVDLGELVVGAGEADVEAFDFAVPAFAFGFADPGGEVVADLGDARPLGGVGPEHRAADAPLTELASMFPQFRACLTAGR